MEVPPLMRERWRAANLTGEAKHSCIVRVRKGRMERGYFHDAMLDGTVIYPPLIRHGVNFHCWKGQWRPLGDWMQLPNVSSVKWSRSFQDKSAAAATILMDDVAFVESAGVAGIYHDIKRGYFSPMRGHKVFSRPSEWASTDWTDVLNGGYQVEVWEGYGTDSEVEPGGDSVVKSFTGLIENCEMESHPDHITITARDFTMLLTDERLFLHNKAVEIRAPVTFADRKWTEGEEITHGKAAASSGKPTSKERTGVQWQSEPRSSHDDVEWVQIELPAGHYEEFMVQTEVDGYEMAAALYAAPGSKVNDHTALPTGWVDLGRGTVVYGSDDPVPWVTRVHKFNDDPHRFKLGPPRPGLEGVEGFQLTDGSKLRLYFTHLRERRDTGKFFARVKAFYALRFGNHPGRAPGARVNAKHWILVEDAADVIRMVLIWAGFREFYVEDFGWTLMHPLQFGEDTFYMDVIDEVLKQGNFVFHMAPPSADDASIGVPHFERQKATTLSRPGMVEVRDSDMVEALQVTWDLSELPNIIRYRGNIDKSGQLLDGDLSRRFGALYFPPWSHSYLPLWKYPDDWLRRRSPWTVVSPEATERDAGVLRQFTQTLGNIPAITLDSDEECGFACLLAAIQYALEMATGEFQVAGLPAFDLNGHVSVVEEATGVNSRLWVASVESEHTLGPQGTWHMKVGGSLIDIPDLYLLTADYHWAFKRMLTYRPPSSHKRRSIPTDPDTPDVRRYTGSFGDATG